MPKKRKRTFPAEFESLEHIDRFVVDAAERAGFDDCTVYQIQLAVDEACSNIIEHAYEGEDRGTIECTLRTEKKGLIVTLRDYGRSFEPESVPDPDIHADIEERTGGGLGLFFIRQIMDEVIFDFDSEKGNVLTLIKLRESGRGESSRS